MNEIKPSSKWSGRADAIRRAQLTDARRNATARKRSHALTSQERERMAQSAEVRAQLRAGRLGELKTFVSEPEPVAPVLSAAAKHAAKKRARAAAAAVAPNAALVELHRRQAERAAMTAGTSSYRSTAS